MNTFDWNFKKQHQRTTMTNIHRKVIAFLEDRKINIEIEKEFPPYSVDIYIPSLNVAVECDGNKWHGGKNGCDRDRNRDKFLIKNCKINKVYRILGTDIEINDKLNLILDGILDGSLISKLVEGDMLILNIKEKNYKGIVTKLNKHSYTAKFDKLDKKLTIDNNGLVKLDGKWCRCVHYNKQNAIPIWCKSISNLVRDILNNKSLDECSAVIKKIKNKLKKFL
jgi:very-short-patch-repair endonuclease